MEGELFARPTTASSIGAGRPTTADEYQSSLFATPDLFTWLGKQAFDPQICFYEELNMYDHYTGEVVGLKKITITETSHKALPAYNIHVQIDWKIGSKQEILIAKLYPWLQLINSTIQNLKDGIVQHFTSYESSDDGRVVASDGGASSTDHMPIFHIGKTEATRFLCEASWYPLCRLIANEQPSVLPSSFSFLGVAKKKPSRINVKWELDTTSKATTVKFDAAPKIDYVRNEPKMLGMTSAEYTFNMSGKCSDIHYPAIFWARKPFKVGESKKETDPFQSHNFNNNLELMSEYNAIKEDISKDHEEYVSKHPELYDLMSDYLQMLLHRKPHDVYEFTVEFFSKK